MHRKKKRNRQKGIKTSYQAFRKAKKERQEAVPHPQVTQEEIENVDGELGVLVDRLPEPVVQQPLDLGLLRQATAQGEQDVRGQNQGAHLTRLVLGARGGPGEPVRRLLRIRSNPIN